MPGLTLCAVLPFARTPDGDLVGLEAEQAPSKGAAIFRATTMVGRRRGDDLVVGAIAHSCTGELQTGRFEDAVILARSGKTPEDAS